MISQPGPGGLPPAGAPITLETLLWDWGDAYTIGYRHDEWLAARRDDLAVLCAATLPGLDQMIQADYRNHPVPRECDLPDRRRPGQGRRRGGAGDDESFLLTALAEAFPAWTISYSFTTGTWTARTRKKTIRQPTAVLLAAALVLGERRYRQSPAG
jgi:hypothetical protein